jgi:hypothetical protein
MHYFNDRVRKVPKISPDKNKNFLLPIKGPQGANNLIQ